MSTTILPIRSPQLTDIQPLPQAKPADTPPAESFSNLLSSSINTVEQSTQNAANATQKFLSGENEDLHTVAIATQQADLTTDLFLQVRNKAISAYQEIMKMQL